MHNFADVFSSGWEPFRAILGSKSDAKSIEKKRLKLRAPKGKPRGQPAELRHHGRGVVI